MLGVGVGFRGRVMLSQWRRVKGSAVPLCCGRRNSTNSSSNGSLQELFGGQAPVHPTQLLACFREYGHLNAHLNPLQATAPQLRLCVCVCVCVCVNTFIRTLACIYMCVFTDMLLCIHSFVCVCVCVCIALHASEGSLAMRLCVCVCVCVCVPACHCTSVALLLPLVSYWGWVVWDCRLSGPLLRTVEDFLLEGAREEGNVGRESREALVQRLREVYCGLHNSLWIVWVERELDG